MREPKGSPTPPSVPRYPFCTGYLVCARNAYLSKFLTQKRGIGDVSLIISWNEGSLREREHLGSLFFLP